MSPRGLNLPVLAFLTMGAAGLAFSPARGADLDYGYGDVPQPAPETKVEFGSGWYIRGDIALTRSPSVSANSPSYDQGQITNVITSGSTSAGCATNTVSPNCYYNNAYQYNRSAFNGPNPGSPAIALTNSSQIGYDATLGGGYQFNRWFRVDATFDFLKPIESSYVGPALPCITGTAPLNSGSGAGTVNTSENIESASCSPTLSAALKSYAALVNGYVDLGTWWRITPYVGAGIGLSFGHASTSLSYTQNNGVPYHVAYSDYLSGSSFAQNWDQHGSSQYYNLAFALMGGVAIDVYDHTKLDLGYRYLHLGEVLGANVKSQQVRAGLRYMIDN